MPDLATFIKVLSSRVSALETQVEIQQDLIHRLEDKLGYPSAGRRTN